MNLSERIAGALGATHHVLRELGGGGMSRLFLARDAILQREVVAKVLPPELAAGVSIERFKREILIGAALQHPHIVPILSAGEVDGLPYYVMPFVRGESLRERLRRDPALTVREGLTMLRDVARALAYAHRAGVVHRDMKPENVLLTDGIAVVADFGIAKALSGAGRSQGEDALTGTGIAVGTPMYMAPEQVAGDAHIDHRADIYAFGVVAYEVMSGRPPFTGKSPRELLAAQMTEIPRPVRELRDGIPAGVAQLIAHCLAKDPSERPDSARALVWELDVALSDAGELATALSGEPRRITRVIATYCIATAAMIGGAWAATVAIGLPNWVMAGTILLGIGGLPVVMMVSAARLAAYRALAPSGGHHGGRSESWDRWMRVAVTASRRFTWKRLAIAAVVVFSVFGISVAAYMTLRALGVGPVGSLLAKGRLDEASSILVADFSSTSSDSTLARIASEGVRVGLQQSNAVRVLAPQAVSSALQRMRRSRDEPVTPAVAQEIARREGARAIVTGDIARTGDALLVTLSLVSADSGHTLARATATAATGAELLDAVDRTTRELRARIGESLKRVRASPPLQRVTTASMEALEKFTRASHANDVLGDYPLAIALLKEAVAIDTGFASAWRKLGIAYANGRLGSRGAAADALERAYRHRDRLTDKERWITEGAYFVGKDRGRAIAAYERLLETDTGVAITIAGLLLSRREYARVETLLRWYIDRYPDVPHPYYNYFRSLLSQGKPREADSASEAVANRLPALAAARAEVVCAVRTRAECEHVLESVRMSAQPQQRAAATRLLIDIALMQGQLQRAERLMVELNEFERARGGEGVSLEGIATRVDIFIRQRPDLARPRLERDSVPSAALGTARAAMEFAWVGDTARARALLKRVSEQAPDSSHDEAIQAAIQLSEAFLAVAEKRWRDAIASFTAVYVRPDGPAGAPAIQSRALARVYDQAGMADSAVAMYEQYLATPMFPRSADDAYMLANAYERLAILNESLGRRAKAAEYAAKFIDLWRDADRELQPRVEMARELLVRVGRSAGD